MLRIYNDNLILLLINLTVVVYCSYIIVKIEYTIFKEFSFFKNLYCRNRRINILR